MSLQKLQSSKSFTFQLNNTLFMDASIISAVCSDFDCFIDEHIVGGFFGTLINLIPFVCKMRFQVSKGINHVKIVVCLLRASSDINIFRINC